MTRNAVRATLAATGLLAVLLPLLLLAVGALPYRVYVIHTGSMTPTIPSRSAVIVKVGEYRIGNVTTFTNNGEVITHRLIGRNNDGTYNTKGDANETADPWTVPPDHIIGTVIAAPRGLGYWLTYFRHPVGEAVVLLCVVCIGLLQSIAADLSGSDDPTPRSRAGRHRLAHGPV
ncbi:signal peptidase I [Jatrophihabitans sp. DSM 45814]